MGPQAVLILKNIKLRVSFAAQRDTQMIDSSEFSYSYPYNAQEY
jgi:hypothetical protein